MLNLHERKFKNRESSLPVGKHGASAFKVHAKKFAEQVGCDRVGKIHGCPS